MKKNKKLNLFIIKLISITISIIIVITFTYNIIFADKVDKIFQLIEVSSKENREYLKSKIRNELKKSLEKETLFYEEDKVLLKKFYNKLINELKN